jgi:uncharacterized Ntn-hydrolase superfamily protein
MLHRPWVFNTFTVVARCPREGHLGIALTSSPLSVTSRCVFIKANVGAVATQAYAHPGLGPLALNLLEAGYSPQKTISELRESDSFPEHRQHAIVDRNGVSAVFTGGNNLDWKGHKSGPNYVVMGNYLVGPQVVDAMEDAWRSSEAEILEERLMRTIEAGRDAGGEKGGQFSSGLVVFGRDTYARTDLRVDMHQGPAGTDAVHGLRAIFDEYKPLIPYYEERPTNPLLDSWRKWREQSLAAPK